ncbi:MAG: hypothetical protein NTX25_08020 [Proteobacteria bacterium]|nr:hypothetical protein [Pseudomonadota bacterium]
MHWLNLLSIMSAVSILIAILEKKSFVSADCKQLEISLRYYLSSNVTNKNFIGKLWEVHVFLVSKSLASAASQAESCGYKQWQAMTWYNLTNAQCKLGEKASVIDVPLAAKDSTIIQSPYTYDPVSKVLSLQVMNKIPLSLSLVK